MGRVLTIDIGSTGIKGALIDERGEITEKQTLPTPMKIRSTDPGRFEINPELILDTLILLISHLKEDTEDDITSIWIDTQMHGFILCDHENIRVSNYITWQDRLAEPYLDEIKPQLVIGSERIGTRFKAGLALCSFYARRNSFERGTYYIHTLGTYLIQRLSGFTTYRFATHPTMAASLGMYDVEKGIWNEHLKDTVFEGYNMILPEIVSEGEQLGSYQGIPIYGDIGDHQAGIYGADDNEEKSIFVTLGTGGIVSFPVRYPSYGDFETRPYFENGYILTKTGQMGGRDLDVIVNMYYELLRDFYPDTDIKSLWERLLSGKLIGTDLKINPDFHESSGMLDNIGPDNFSYRKVFDASLEAMARGLTATVHSFRNISEKADSIIINGGRLAHSAKVLEAFEKASDMKIVVSELRDENLFGLARLDRRRREK